MGKFPKSADDKRESEKPLPSLHLFVSFLLIAAGGADVFPLDGTKDDARKLSKRRMHQKLWMLCFDLIKEMRLQ
jgi:hypothetical protein